MIAKEIRRRAFALCFLSVSLLHHDIGDAFFYYYIHTNVGKIHSLDSISNASRIFLVRYSMSSLEQFTSEQVSELINERKRIIICFDPNHETKKWKKQLEQINDNVIFHTKWKRFIHLMESIEKEKIFLIIPCSQVSSRIMNHHQIEAIFLFSFNNDQYQYLLFDDSRIIGIYDNVDRLCSSLEERIKLMNKQLYQWNLFDPNEYKTKDLSKQSNDFLWYQLFHDVISHFSYDENARQEMIDLYYQNNLQELNLLDEFEQNYHAKESLLLFKKNVFLHQLINRALKTKNIDQLYSLRYFLTDLINNIEHRHQQIIQSNREYLIVYREMHLLMDELNQLRENQGQLISLKGFLMTSTVRSVSPSTSTNGTDLISVLFQIEFHIKELSDQIIFGEIDSLSLEETFLFDFNTTFQLENIEQIEQIWMIKLKVVNHGRIILQKYIDDTHRQIEHLSLPILFGKFICDMGQWNQSINYFQCLMKDSHEDLAWIEHSIGQAYQWKGQWDQARIFYDQAYHRIIRQNIKYSSIVLNDIGELLFHQGKYEESIDYHQSALTIQKNYFPSNHPHIATSLSNIALIHHIRLKYDEALISYDQALTIQEEYYNHFHLDIAKTLNRIGHVLYNQRKLDQAFDYHQRAMSIYKNYYQLDHVYIASTLNHIGHILYRQEKYDESLNNLQQALTIFKQFYPSGYIDTGFTLNNIGHIRYGQGKYNEAVQLYQQTLSIFRKYYLSHHINIVWPLNNIGLVLFNGNGNGNCEEALHYHQDALSMLNIYYPSYYAHIAMTLNYMGDIFLQQEKYNEALNLFNQALQIEENYYTPYHVELATTLANIGHALFNQGKPDQAMHFYQRLLSIQENNSLTDHIDICNTFNHIGNLLRWKETFDQAIEFHSKALLIQKKHSPLGCSIAHTLDFIGNIFRDQHNYDQALDYYQQALQIRKNFYSFDHVDIATSFSYIGNILKNQENYNDALDFLKRALTIRQKYCSFHHLNIVDNLESIAAVLREQRELDEALDYYSQSAVILEEFHPTNHRKIATILISIALIWFQKSDSSRCINYLERSLRIRETSLSSEPLLVAGTLASLSVVQLSRGQYHLSLMYELRCFLIREKVLPPDHQHIGESLSCIGKCYDKLNQLKLSLEYYKRASLVYQSLPHSHEDLSNVQSKIEELSFRIEEMNE